jgi:peptide/nickel transport system substrate-binding protein
VSTSGVDVTTPVPGDWVIVGFPAEPEGLNPVTVTTSYANDVLYGSSFSLIFETLLQYNTKDWTLTKPLLAESTPEISPDHLSYTYTIRNGVRWHDGQPLTAEDVLFSAKATMYSLVDSASMRSNFSELTDVQLLDGRRIRFTFGKPNFMNAFTLGSTMPIVSRHVFDPQGVLDKVTFKDLTGAKGQSDAKLKAFAEEFNKSAQNRKPIGTGPYKFEHWDTAKEIVVTRDDGYWGTKAHLQKIVFRFIQDSTARLTALKSGELDFDTRLEPIQYAQQAAGDQFDKQFAKAPVSTPLYRYIGWNMDRPYFKDKRVRQALTMLIDRQQIIDTLWFGLAKPLESPVYESSPEFNPNLKPWPYDPKRAGELLDQAGWKDTDGDGIRDKDGVPFRFEIQGPTGNDFIEHLMPILKESFRRAGIDMQERRLEFTVLVQNLKSRKFDACTLAWSLPLEDDGFQLWHSSSIANGGSNAVGFRNAESDKLLETGRMEFDSEKRKQIYWKWQEIIHDEQPYTFLLIPKEPMVYQKRFQNVTWLPVSPGYDLTQWFVPLALQKYTNAPTP